MNEARRTDVYKRQEYLQGNVGKNTCYHQGSIHIRGILGDKNDPIQQHAKKHQHHDQDVYKRQGTHRPVGGKDRAVPVNDLPSFCLDLPLPLVKRLRFLLIISGLKYHQIDKTAGQKKKDDHSQPEDHQQLFPVIGSVFHKKTS